MSEYEAVLRIEGDTEPPINVEVDLTDDHLSLRAGEMELASWERSAIRVSALPDGFHVLADGEALVLDVTEDAKFALELGMRNAHPTLRRRMSALLREDQPF